MNYFLETNDPVLTTAEVAERADFETSTGMNKRLKKLQKRGLVKSKNAGNGLVWWLTDEGEQRVRPQE